MENIHSEFQPLYALRTKGAKWKQNNGSLTFVVSRNQVQNLWSIMPVALPNELLRLECYPRRTADQEKWLLGQMTPGCPWPHLGKGAVLG